MNSVSKQKTDKTHSNMNRRDFLKTLTGIAAAGLTASLSPSFLQAAGKSPEKIREIKAADYFKTVRQDKNPVIVLHGDYTFAAQPVIMMKNLLLKVKQAYPNVSFYEFRAEKFMEGKPMNERIISYIKLFRNREFRNGASFPATFLFCRRDNLNGKAYKENRLIDIIGGGPKTDDEKENMIDDLINRWLPSNTEEHDTGIIWRYDNDTRLIMNTIDPGKFKAR